MTQLGKTGPEVFPIALGCMGMSPGVYGAAPDEKDGIATIQAAIERGVNLIDTGDFYSMGHNEMLVQKALVGRRYKVQLSVKFGGMRDPAGAFVGIDTRPAAIQNFLAYSLRRLGTDHVDIYRPARLDPNDSETLFTLGLAMRELDQIDGAAAVLGFSAAAASFDRPARGICTRM